MTGKDETVCVPPPLAYLRQKARLSSHEDCRFLRSQTIGPSPLRDRQVRELHRVAFVAACSLMIPQMSEMPCILTGTVRYWRTAFGRASKIGTTGQVLNQMVQV